MVLLNVFLLFFSVFALTATASAPAPKGGIDLFFGVTVSKVALLYVIGLGTVGSFVVV